MTIALKGHRKICTFDTPTTTCFVGPAPYSHIRLSIPDTATIVYAKECVMQALAERYAREEILK